MSFACERGLSKRRACELLKVARSALSYRSVREGRDAPAMQAMRRLAAQYPRYGYRRIRIFLREEGYVMSRHRAHRLWRGGPTAAATTAAPPCSTLPASPAARQWHQSGLGYDFVFDACANDQSLKCLT
jgi:putative transposase